jgi:hypothetical protein
MSCKRIMSLVALLGVAGLVACGSATPPPGAQRQAVHAQVSAPEQAQSLGQGQAPGQVPGSAGVKAFIDPVTGELRAPTEAEQRTGKSEDVAGVAASKANAKPLAPVTSRRLSDGRIVYDIGERGMVDEVVCVQPDGSIAGKCPKASQKASQ